MAFISKGGKGKPLTMEQNVWSATLKVLSSESRPRYKIQSVGLARWVGFLGQIGAAAGLDARLWQDTTVKMASTNVVVEWEEGCAVRGPRALNKGLTRQLSSMPSLPRNSARSSVQSLYDCKSYKS
jgi:hypothetical protein